MADVSTVQEYLTLIRGFLEDCERRRRKPAIILLNPVVSEKLLEDVRRKTGKKVEAGWAALPTYTLQGVTVYVTARVRDVYLVDDRSGPQLLSESRREEDPGE